MSTVWVLVLIFGYDRSGVPVVINNLPSYQECARVYGEVKALNLPREVRAKCIEVKK